MWLFLIGFSVLFVLAWFGFRGLDSFFGSQLWVDIRRKLRTKTHRE